MKADGLAIHEATENGRRIIHLAGELDLRSAARLEHRLSQLTAAQTEIVLELSQLAFIDSTGIALIIRAAQAAHQHNGRLELRDPTPAVRRVLDLCRVEAVLKPPRT